MRYINDAMKKNDTPKDGLINRIIELEWDMFDKVTNTGGRAACQDDEWTFYVMRFSQFSALSEAMLQSYKQDPYIPSCSRISRSPYCALLAAPAKDPAHSSEASLRSVPKTG